MHSCRLNGASATSSEMICFRLLGLSSSDWHMPTRSPRTRAQIRCTTGASYEIPRMSFVNLLGIICLCIVSLFFNSRADASSAVLRKDPASGWPDTAQSINQETVEIRPAWPGRPRRSPLVANQFHSASPKLIQWSREAVQYYEGSTLVLSCSLSLSGGEQPIKFAWFKNGKPLSGQGVASLQLSPSPSTSSSSSALVPIHQHHRLSIETLTDYSFLRLAELRPSDSGAYTCAASNSLGQEDRTTTQVLVNVKLKWIINSGSRDRERGAGEGPGNSSTATSDEYQIVKARAGESVVFECNASGGQPRPRVRWYRLVPSGGGTGAKVAPFAKTLGHAASGLQALTTASRATGLDVATAHALDEIQLRAMLEKLKLSSRGDTLPFYRHELVNRSNDGSLGQDKLVPQQSAVGNGSATGVQQQAHQFKWRVETSTSSVGSTGESPHEIYSRLILDRLEPAAAGLYECDVSASASAFTGGGYTSDQMTSSSPGQLLHGGSQDGPSQSAHSSSNQLQLQLQAQAGGGAGEKLRRHFGLLVNGWSSRFFSQGQVKFGHFHGESEVGLIKCTRI